MMRIKNMIFWRQWSVIYVTMVILCGCTGQLNATTITLASRSITGYQIVRPASASSIEEFASDELKRYLDQISDADFGTSNRSAPHMVVVGAVSRLHKLVPDIAIPAVENEGYAIFIRNDNLYLTGSNDRAVLYAVYDFLTRLGCRWIAPDFSFYENTSHFIPRKKELEYSSSSDIIGQPAMAYRKLYIEEGRSHNTANLLQLIDWMPKNRFNILVAPIDYRGHGKVKWDNWRKQLIPELEKRGIIIEVGGHGYQNFLNVDMEDGKLFQKHPEFFGMAQDGRRSREQRRVFCTSNPEAVKYLQHHILLYLQSHPEIRIFDFWPPDSEIWCECPACKAMGSPTDRHALLVSQTAKFLQMECPGIRLECIAYSRYVEPPQHEVLDSSVLLDFCPIRQSFEYQIYEEGSKNNKAYKEDLMQWLKVFKGDISIYSYYRKYAWRSLPNIIPHYIQRDLQFYRDTGAMGISVYAEPGDWFTYGLNHFMLGHLAWDPDANVDSLTMIYSTELYGPAADMAVSVYKMLEEVVRYGCSIPHTSPKSAGEYARYRDKIGDNSRKIRKAMKDNASDPVLHGHLHRLALMLDYADKNIALTAMKASGSQEEEINRLEENIKELISENAGSGVFIAR